MDWLFWEIDGFTERMSESKKLSYHIRCLPKQTDIRMAEIGASHLADQVDDIFELVAKIKRRVRIKDDVHNTLFEIDAVCDRIMNKLLA